MKGSLTFILGLLVTSKALTIKKTITQSCTVQTDQGELDLSSIAGKSSAAFSTNVPSGVGQGVLYWNPCNDVTPDGCSDQGPGQIFVVTTTTTTPVTTVCTKDGSKSEATFVVVNDQLALNYSGRETPFLVNLKCSKGSVNAFSLPQDQTNPSALLAGSGACFNNVVPTTVNPSSGSSNNGLSGGSILLIIVLVLIVVYLTAGILIMKLIKKAEGTDVIPNKGFWIIIPGLVKDGVLFAVRRGKVPSQNSYDNM